MSLKTLVSNIFANLTKSYDFSIRGWDEKFQVFRWHFNNVTLKRHLSSVLLQCLGELMCVVMILRFYKFAKFSCFPTMEKKPESEPC